MYKFSINSTDTLNFRTSIRGGMEWTKILRRFWKFLFLIPTKGLLILNMISNSWAEGVLLELIEEILHFFLMPKYHRNVDISGRIFCIRPDPKHHIVWTHIVWSIPKTDTKSIPSDRLIAKYRYWYRLKI